MVSEDQLIERVRRKFPSTADGLRAGIGDDAAVIRPAGRAEWVVTTDAFLENVHFLRHAHPPKAVGYKALARATSDLAAMGARSRYFLLTLALPLSCTKKWLDEFLDGMALAARRFGLILVGGDTTKYPTVVVSLTVIGEIDPGRAILRSGARSGDLICVSGKLGEAEAGSAAGAEEIAQEKTVEEDPEKTSLSRTATGFGRVVGKQRMGHRDDRYLRWSFNRSGTPLRGEQGCRPSMGR